MEERLLALHVGTLYSCPTQLTSEGVPTNRSSGGISARCLVPARTCTATTLQLSKQQHLPSDGSLEENSARAAALAASASGPIREVFCRAVPLLAQAPVQPSDSATPTRGATAERSHDGVVDGLREALGLMYRDFHAVRSPNQPVTAVADPQTRRDDVVDDGAAQPSEPGTVQQAMPMLSACTRLHAGLVPLYTPLVESGDGVFLVRILFCLGVPQPRASLRCCQ